MIDVGTFPILSLVAFLPLIGAIAVAILPASLARGTALAFGLATWVVSLVMLVRSIPKVVGFQFVESVRGSRASGSPTRSARMAWRSRWWS